MLTAEDILNPTKPPPATVNAVVLAFEVMIDEIPVLKGAADEAQGTDLAGTVCLVNLISSSLALKEPLKASKIEVQLYGAAMEKANASSSSVNIHPSGEYAILVYEAVHSIWSSPAVKSLAPGAHDIRFAFKLPGNLPATEAGRVQYVLRAVITEGDKEVLSLAEAVRIRRVLPGSDENEQLPEYIGGDDVPGYFAADSKATLAPAYTESPPDGHHVHSELPPDYNLKGKARA
ncbi:UNVERIFIED_CONTAM: hypothetical protein HDU68_000399 [Siphonaria sp. JEL0065]|nr:hypothetical protein HDU68_000399 [Siphonaria sp. JEL0065]